MKKSLVLFMMIIVLVFVTACGETTNQENTSAVSSTPTPQATPIEKEEAKPETSSSAVTDVSLNPDGVFEVVLIETGTESLKVLSTIRNELGLDLTSAKALVDAVPSVLESQLTLAEAEQLKATIEAEGAVLQIVETEKIEVATTGLSVVLTDKGIGTLNVVKEIRDQLGLGLAEAKELVDNTPSIIAENITLEEAELLKAALEAVGATVEIQQ